MTNEVAHLRSSIPGKAPEPEQMFPGRLAMNTADEVLYILNAAGEVVAVASSAALARALSAVQTVNDEQPDADGNVELQSRLELAVSLPQLPEPGLSLFYQVLGVPTTFIEGRAILEPASGSVALPLRVDGSTVGTIAIGPGGTNFPALPDLEPGQTLEVLGPVNWGTVTKLSLLFIFEVRR